MNINLAKYLFITLLIILAKAEAAMAGQIYKWTDPEGLTHYSEVPPVVIDESVNTLAIDLSGYLGNAGNDDYYSVVNQVKRMEESRHKKERLRLERDAQRLAERKARRKKEPVQVVIQRPSYPVYRYVPVFRAHGLNKHRKKHHHKRHREQSANIHTGHGKSYNYGFGLIQKRH